MGAFRALRTQTNAAKKPRETNASHTLHLCANLEKLSSNLCLSLGHSALAIFPLHRQAFIVLLHVERNVTGSTSWQTLLVIQISGVITQPWEAATKLPL